MKTTFYLILTIALVDLGLLHLVDWQWLTGLWLLVTITMAFGSSQHASEAWQEAEGCGIEVCAEAEVREHDVRSGLLRPPHQAQDRGHAQCEEVEK